MIYVSTGGTRMKSGPECAEDFYLHGITGVELSSGAYLKDQKSAILALPQEIELQIHNYYPPPKIPFIFNLASIDSEVLEMSINHAREAMYLALEINRPIYSFHAGFRLNPDISELGKKFMHRNLSSRSDALSRFGESVLKLAEEARLMGVRLLVENNVVTPQNHMAFGEDPMLLTAPDEITKFMSEMPSNVKLLLDVAHFKVSGAALGFELVEGHTLVSSHISGYHLSDNNGEFDSNEPFNNNSWFWDCLNLDANFFTLEIYNQTSAELFQLYKNAEEKIKLLKNRVKENEG